MRFNILPDLFAQIRIKEEGGLNYLVIFITYLGETQLPEDVEKLIEQTKQFSAEVGGEMLNTRKTLLSQAEKKGELKEKIDMIERFLKAGAPWEMVIKATGITPEKLAELKVTLQEIMDRRTKLKRSRQLS